MGVGNGWLEQGMLLGISSAMLSGIPIYVILHSVYGGRKSNAAAWLVEQVANEAVALGLGHFDHGPGPKHFEWNDATKAQIEHERTALMAFVNRLGEVQPDVLAELDSSIRLSINLNQQDSC